MLSRFYQRFGLRVLLLAALTFPFFYYHGETISSNNDIEAWLPENSDVRVEYEEFKTRFGAEEVILIGMNRSLGVSLIESLCGRIERLPGIRHCWSPDRLSEVMREHSVTQPDIQRRLEGMFVSKDGERVGVVAMLSEAGIIDRAGTVAGIRQVLEYCQLTHSGINIAGAPVVIAELNRLGGRENNKIFFMISLAISASLLFYQLQDWRLTGMILGLTVLAIEVSVTVLKLSGGEMNFVLDALPVMVMVFTLEVSVHLLNYWQNTEGEPDRFDAMLRHAFKPCFLATFTTAIGLWSLCFSQFIPVRQFGWAGSMGSIVALVIGMVFTPAVIAVCPPRRREAANDSDWFHKASGWMLVRSRPIVAVGVVAVFGLAIGLTSLRAYIDPLAFLPPDSIVLRDMLRIRADLTNTDTVEATVDFGRDPMMAAWPFVKRLEYVRGVENRIAKHPAVAHTMSLASLFPTKMPEGFELTQLLNRATKRQQDNDFLAGGEQYWRISANITKTRKQSQQRTFAELSQEFADVPNIRFTGIAPLIDKAQHDIYSGFWSSFMSAFWMIMLVMVVSLRWPMASIIGMLPNVAPIAVVFGFMGWMNLPVDIGMMMSGSISLGIAVDGAFHLLVRYREVLTEKKDKAQAIRIALQETGPPILQATLIMSIGMLALTFSSFGPTALFGWLMCATLLTSLLGDLVLLPCLLGFFHTQRLAELEQAAQRCNGEKLKGPYFLRLLRNRYGLSTHHIHDDGKAK
ncbi:MAG: MMPL family transporter [Planctomycetia bacterium]|nr:MMPL family transporter [Planctomycetia bacterium]